MGLYDKFQDDEELDNKGVTLELEDDDRPLCRIRMARAGGLNKKFTAAVEKVRKKYGKLFAVNAVSEDKNREIMIEVHADTTVLDWETWKHEGFDKDGKPLGEWVRGIEAPNGEVIPFNRENVVATFKALPTIYEAAVAHATDSQLYNRAYIDAAVKNS